MKVVVTGGAGFIGSNLCSLLIEEGVKVAVIDDLSTGFRQNLQGLDVEFIEGSILDLNLTNDVISESDAVVHLAALGSVPRSVKNPIASHEVNVTGTVNVLQSARLANAHFIYASSSSVYGYVKNLPRHEELPTRPSSPYGASKLSAESYVLAFGKTYNLDVLALRFFNVYGPKQASGHAYAAVVPTFIEAAISKKPIFIDGDGEQTRDFTFVSTVTNTILSALNRRLALDIPVNLALGSSVSINELASLIQSQFENQLEILHRDSRVGDVRKSPSDPKLFKQYFNEIESVNLQDGLQQTIDWYKLRI